MGYLRRMGRLFVLALRLWDHRNCYMGLRSMILLLISLSASIVLTFILWLGTQDELPDGEGF